MSYCGPKRNFMDELNEILCEIEKLKPEPEVCNVRCPPLGCPRGPCPGMCCYEGLCDACCVSEMPCFPPLPHPPRCCAPPCLKAYAKSVGCPPESCLSSWKGGCSKSGHSSSCGNSRNMACSSTKGSPFCSTVPTCVTPCCPPNGALACRPL